MNLYPTILTDSLTEFKQQVDLVKQIPEIEVIQVDVIDGLFADDVTLTPIDLLEVDFADLQIDWHLMTEEPLDYAHEIFSLQNKLPTRAVIAQVEKMTSQQEFIEFLKSKGFKVGLSLNLFTPLSAIDKQSWANLDILQLMAVEAGAQNQKFNFQILEKIKQVKQPVEIIVDGGVKLENFTSIIKAGAHSLAVGSALWKAPDLATTIDNFLSYESAPTA